MDNWTPDELQIFELFHWRCAVNKAHKAIVLHEIVPKSKRPKTWQEPLNRIPLCAKCHDMIHAVGASKWKGRLSILRISVEKDASTKTKTTT